MIAQLLMSKPIKSLKIRNKLSLILKWLNFHLFLKVLRERGATTVRISTLSKTAKKLLLSI
jgi:hypothetical protein